MPLPVRSGVVQYSPMPRFAGRLAVLLQCVAAPVLAQGSPYLPLDDPRAALVEHLITRGDLRDPSPMIRPLRRADILAALAAAQPAPGSPAHRVMVALREEFAAPASEAWWRVGAEGGLQGFTSARRDQRRPAGPGGTRGYAALQGELAAGALVLVTRGVAENRLKLDPDWPGDATQQQTSMATRFTEAYIAGHWRYARLVVGQRARNWGPIGLEGIGISDAGYPRADLEFAVTAGPVQFTAIGARLRGAAGLDGTRVGRYFAAHRLAISPSPRLTLALWETAVIADRFDVVDTDFFNPLTLLSFPTRFGWGDDRNVLIGGDVSWRPRSGLTLEMQAGLDDFNPGSENPYPNRWALAFGASGPMGGAAAWQLRYSTATSLAFRTGDPVENFLDAGVGLGRNHADTEEWHARISLPLRGRWLVAPEGSLIRQGEGDPRLPWPTPEEAAGIPTRFIGTVTTSFRFGLGIAGAEGPLKLAGMVAWHQGGADDPGGGKLQARVTATLGFTTGGGLR